MKRLLYVFVLAAVATMASTGCRQTQQPQETDSLVDSLRADTTFIEEVDSTQYGICGNGTAMHTLELVTDGGDTLYYTFRVEEDASIVGGMMCGDRMAVMGKTVGGGLVATKIINLTTLLGKWTSLDKNFEIVEGGLVSSSVEAESNPWVSWKILNGRLLLNADTFEIAELGADSLYLENATGIFVYRRASLE